MIKAAQKDGEKLLGRLVAAPYQCRTITQMDCLEPPRCVQPQSATRAAAALLRVHTRVVLQVALPRRSGTRARARAWPIVAAAPCVGVLTVLSTAHCTLMLGPARPHVGKRALCSEGTRTRDVVINCGAWMRSERPSSCPTFARARTRAPVSKTAQGGAVDGWLAGCRSVLFPQIQMLDQLVAEYPGAKFLLMTRDPKHWARSMIGWTTPRRGTLFERLQRSELPDLPQGEPKDADGLVLWQRRQYAAIRRKFQDDPRYSFMEYSIETGDPAKLIEFVGMPPSFIDLWTVENVNTNLHPATAGKGGAKTQ